LNADEIAKCIGISRRTVFNWIQQFDWKKPPPRSLQLWELQEAASAMLHSLEKNPEYYNKSTVNEMFKFFDFVLNEEQKVAKSATKNPSLKGLTPRGIKEIQREYLGMDV
jgi:hypothetical protein